MRIKKLELKNFRGFEDLTIDFPEGESGLAVFVGVNGSGKTSVLEGIARGLKRVSDGLLPNGQDDFDMRLNLSQIRVTPHQIGSRVNLERHPEYKIGTTVILNGKEISWFFTDSGGNDTDIRPKTQQLRHNVANNGVEILPMIAFYNTKRYWTTDEFQKTELISDSSRLDPYTDCLNPTVSSQLLYVWFRRMKLIQLENESLELPPELKAVFDAINDALKKLNALVSPKNIQAFFSIKDNDLFIHTGIYGVIPFRMLSEGYRSILGMIADIAYRMAELNPHERNDTPGIILIDEIEQHLHPAWQRSVIQALREIFPNIQFILTTHSPQVLSTLKKENVFILEDFKLVKDTPHTFGRDSNAILWDIFGVEKRPPEAKEEFAKLYRIMDDPEKVGETADMLQDVEAKYGYYDEEVVRARGHFQFLNEA